MGFNLCDDLGSQKAGTVIDWTPSPSTCSVEQHGSDTFPFAEGTPIDVGPGTSNQGTLISTAGGYKYYVTCCLQETATKTVTIVVSQHTGRTSPKKRAKKAASKAKPKAKKKAKKKATKKAPAKKSRSKSRPKKRRK